MTKAEYREYFAQCKPLLRMSYFLRLAGIGDSNFSYFMKGNDFLLSLEKLELLYNCIGNEVNSKVV